MTSWPAQQGVDLQSFGLPAVMPLLVIFLAVALPLPSVAHVLRSEVFRPSVATRMK